MSVVFIGTNYSIAYRHPLPLIIEIQYIENLKFLLKSTIVYYEITWSTALCFLTSIHSSVEPLHSRFKVMANGLLAYIDTTRARE